MTSLIKVSSNALAGETLYANLENDAGLIVNGTALEAYNPANIAAYAIPMTEQAKPGNFTAATPAIPAGYYTQTAYIRSGATPAADDVEVGRGRLRWDGEEWEESARQSTLEDVEERTQNLPDNPAAVSDVQLSVNVTPLVGQVGQADPGPALVGYLHSSDTWDIYVFGEDGEPVDLTGKTLRFIASKVKACDCTLSEVFRLEGGSIVITGDDDNQVKITSDPADVEEAGELVWNLWDVTDEDPAKWVMLLTGPLEIRNTTSPT